jgi:hypothetical protein
VFDVHQQNVSRNRNGEIEEESRAQEEEGQGQDQGQESRPEAQGNPEEEENEEEPDREEGRSQVKDEMTCFFFPNEDDVFFFSQTEIQFPFFVSVCFFPPKRSTKE